MDEYIARQTKWKPALILLRKTILSAGLEETVKWGGPAYTNNGTNVVGIAAFKEHFALWFFQGALLKDKNKKLINAQEGVTNALRQWRFTSIDEIDRKLIKQYVLEAKKNQEAGREIKPNKKKPLVIPSELKTALKNNPKLNKSFTNLNLTKQREYVDSIGGAKQEETRLKRLEKAIPLIMKGAGLNDKYRN